MKKYLNISLIYAVLAMAGGVFYREFTKWNGFEGVTVLGKVHTHLFLMGMMVFWVVALFAAQKNLKEIRFLEFPFQKVFLLPYPEWQESDISLRLLGLFC